MNAVTLLKQDHRKVESLFERYRSAIEGKAEILLDITRELSRHMDAEERELYPVLRTSIPDGESLMNDAVTKHKEARGLLVDLSRADAGSFDMDAKVATLQRAIDHHVRDEEDEIFPKAQEALGKKRLEELGGRIAKAKKSAPQRPASSAARSSPGSSVGGMITAATDRVKNLLASTQRKSPRRAARSRRLQKRTSRAKASAAKSATKPRRAPKRTGAPRSASRRAKTSTKSRKPKKQGGRRASR
jgi:hemerythrin superfamily protein